MALVEVPTFKASAGRWSVIGFLITLISVSEVSTARTLNLCRAYAIMQAKVVYVRGTLSFGLRSRMMFFSVWMYTFSLPALFKGESKRLRRQ